MPGTSAGAQGASADRHPRIVIAPDKFKGSLAAPQVAEAVASGLRGVLPGAELVLVPVADGGEGTVAAALGAGYAEHRAKVAGPTGLALSAAYAVRGRDAVVELAAASGLDALPGGVPDPLGATSLGTGQLIRETDKLGIQ